MMKDHMNAVRGVTGASGLLSMAMATDVLNKFAGFKQIERNITMDDFKDNGSYVSTGEYVSGKPGQIMNDDQIILINMAPNNAYTVQIFLASDNYYIRSSVKNQWSSWKRLGGVIKTILTAVLPVRGCAA